MDIKQIVTKIKIFLMRFSFLKITSVPLKRDDCQISY